jgi:hypothetical protein
VFVSVWFCHWPSLSCPLTTLPHQSKSLQGPLDFKMFVGQCFVLDVLSRPWLNNFEQLLWFKGLRNLKKCLNSFGLKITFSMKINFNSFYYYFNMFLFFDFILYVNI